MIEAMGCQKNIVQLIIDQGADYVLALAANQGNLFEDAMQLFDYAHKVNFKEIEHDFYQTISAGHGRVEIRRHRTIGGVKYVIDAEQWQSKVQHWDGAV